jgi:hypothetical protein
MPAKRRSGPGKTKRSHSYKTKKRLATKYAMLAVRAVKAKKQRK